MIRILFAACVAVLAGLALGVAAIVRAVAEEEW